MIGIPRVARVAVGFVVAGGRECELSHVQRAQIECAGGVEALEYGGGGAGHKTLADIRTA